MKFCYRKVKYELWASSGINLYEGGVKPSSCRMGAFYMLPYKNNATTLNKVEKLHYGEATTSLLSNG